MRFVVLMHSQLPCCKLRGCVACFAAMKINSKPMLVQSHHCCCRYNYACVCAHAMASDAVQGDDVAAAQHECLSSLSHLTSLGMTAPEQIMSDPDFSQAREQAWFAPVRDVTSGQLQLQQQA